MKKIGVVYFGLIVVIISLFARFDAMKLLPLTTPESFLGSQPYIQLGDLIMTQPSSTIIVYALGLYIIALGMKFLKQHEQQLSRKWWGISMIFWGVGTILAGTSYQAFGYQIMCVGNSYCNFTNWLEVTYLLLTGISIGLMALGMSYCITVGKTRVLMQRISIGLMALYGIVLVIGTVVPIQILVTYELFNLFFMPLFIWFFVLSINNYRKDKDRFNKRWIQSWILFFFVNLSYYVYYWFGFSEIVLERTGLWFNQNDWLHVMVFVWMAHIWYAISGIMTDKNI